MAHDADAVRVLVRCVHGLEWLCADEIGSALPTARGLELARREIILELPALDAAVLALRTADDAFLVVGQVGGAGTTKDSVPELAHALAALPWTNRVADVHRVRPVPTAPLVDVVASIEGRRSYNRFAVENAVGERLAPLVGGTYLSRTAAGRDEGTPDLGVRVFVRGEIAVAALRVGADPLHRRAYKQCTGPGTLHPPAAAALARLTGPVTDVLDPFCGDGTIAIEAALAHPGAQVRARDADPERLRNAEANAKRAGVSVELSRFDAGLLAPDGVAGAVVTNPPWNLAVDGAGNVTGSLGPFWRRVPGLLAPGGRLVALTEAELDVPSTLRDAGFAVGLGTRIRLAGRVAHVVVAAPPGHPAPEMPAGAARWHERALAAGVVTRSGF
jgi:tRNA (guanine6-N2)-methyltransferase